MLYVVFFFKQKTAYEMRISDWSSDVCSSDLFVAIAARESVRAEADQDSAGPELQHARLDDDPCRDHGEDHREDGNGVTEGNGDKRPHHGGTEAFLHSQGDRKEPAHRRIEDRQSQSLNSSTSFA